MIGVDVPDEVIVHADPGRLGQALDNLLDNAIRHGAPPINLFGTAVNEEVHIQVSDAGPGVPTGLVPRLFERFAIAGRTGGTGLGLFLVREIARGHGGEADVSSARSRAADDVRDDAPRAEPGRALMHYCRDRAQVHASPGGLGVWTGGRVSHAPSPDPRLLQQIGKRCSK